MPGTVLKDLVTILREFCDKTVEKDMDHDDEVSLLDFVDNAISALNKVVCF